MRPKRVRIICDNPADCCHGMTGELDKDIGFVYYDKPCPKGHTMGYLQYPPEKHYEELEK